MNKLIFSALISISLTACGGGGGGSHHGSVNTTSEANGVWHGTIHTQGASSRDITLLVLDGQVAGVSYDSHTLFSGFLIGNDEFLDGNFTEFNGQGEPIDDLSVDGVFHPDDTIDLAYHSSHDVGDIVLDIDPMTYAPASMRILSGHYQDIDSDIDLLITEYGEIDGSDLAGCVYEGHVRVAHDGINIYELVMTRSGCADAANISALATHYGQGVVDVFVIDSNEHMQLWEIDEG